VTVVGMPKHATQLVMNASMHRLASMLRSGTASTHLIDLSMTVNRSHGSPKKQLEDQPGPRAHGRICVLGLEWRGVELPAACGPSSNGKTSKVYYRTLSFFAFRLKKKRKFAFLLLSQIKITIEPVRFASIL
jgi:hypothetical protein